MTVVAVHDGSFHADDVFAVAVLRLVFPDSVVVRTRDAERLQEADFRLDVGGAYDPAAGGFDHHQPDFREKRENGIPYATAGLIWKEFASRLSLSPKEVSMIDQRLIQLIDANDSGHTLPCDEGEIQPFTISRVVEAFNPMWDEPDRHADTAFDEACQVATQVLQNEIRKARGREKARAIVEDALRNSTGLPYILLEIGVPWQEIVVERSNALYVIHPASNGTWRVRAVPARPGSFELRHPLPAEWAGKEGEALITASGVEGATFCHKERFLAGAKTREAAEQLARIAVQASR